MKFSFKSISGNENVVDYNWNLQFVYKKQRLFENVLRRFRRRELHVITGRSELMYPDESSLHSTSPSDIYRWLWCLYNR